MNHTLDALKAALIGSGCAGSMVQRMMDRLPLLPQAYTDALWAYLENGETRLFRSHGYSTGRFMREAELGYPQALSLILWLEVAPDEAMACLETGLGR